MRKIGLLLLLCALTGFGACTRKVGTTSVQVEDSVRHYYPIVTGEELYLNYRLKNTGHEPLVIEDIQPSCGCIVADLSRKVIPPDDEILLQFTFNSLKNVGYVRHVIRLFGNIEPNGMASLVFDVNIVPPADYVPDYEESYREELEKKGNLVEGLVNGRPAEKGYYVDPDHDSRSHPKYPWRE